ncbi:MAG: hypothetical protein IJS60_03345 [Abditibacteriota bacterium]|nr:hypothetical protein [Abditibacteriota bacterium]
MLKWTFVILLLLLSMISFSFEKYELTLLDPKTNVFETKTFDFNKSEIIFEKLKYKVTLDKNKYHNYDTALVTLENLSFEKDRALVAKVHIFSSKTGYNWHYDVTKSTLCEPGKTYFECDYYSDDEPTYNPWVIDLNGRSQSVLPVSVISKSDSSVIWGYFLDSPGVYRMKYRESEQGGVIVFETDLGFSDKTDKFPNINMFRFFIEEKDNEFDMRHALKEYYQNNPDYFEDKNVLGKGREHGAWTLWMRSNVFAPWDFHIAYNQIQLKREDAENKKTDEWQGPLTSYTEPWGYYQMFPPKEGFTKTQDNLDLHQVESKDILRMLKKSSEVDPSLIDTYVINMTQKVCAEVALKTAIYYNPQGDLCSYKWQPCYNAREMTREEEIEAWGYPYFYSMIVENCDPDIEGFNRYDMSLTECDLPNFDGYQLDSLADFATHQDNYRKEQWKYADIPLSFGAETKEVTQPHYYNCLEYLYKLRKHADEQNRVIASNTWMPFITFSAPYLDYIGAGESDVTQYPFRWYYAMRSLVPYKNLSYLDYSIQMNDCDYPENIPVKMEKMLFLGVWPGTGNGWHFPEKVEAIRPYYQKYMPLFKYISEAGWEPVTEAYSPNSDIEIERFGNLDKGNMYLTVRNSKGELGDVILKTDKEVVVYNMKLFLPIPYKRLSSQEISFSLLPRKGTTEVVKVAYKEDLDAFLLKEAKHYINLLNDLTDTKQVWSDDESFKPVKEIVQDKCLDVESLSRDECISLCNKILPNVKNVEGKCGVEATYLIETALKYLVGN